jgi:DNA-binding winged helix-turn-helix (wHTH) protein
MIDLSSKPIYRFEDVEVDASRCSLKRDGIERRVRQQTFQVLLYLLERRHRLVTKEELIENVWQGMAVTDNALVQCIVDIRRALGDDSRNPRFIKTLPKIGYHFIALVEEVCPNGAASAVPVGGNSFEGLNGNQSTVGPKRIGFITSLATTKHRMLFTTALVAVFGVGLYLYQAQRSWGSDKRFSEISVPALPGKKSLVVMDFDNRSGSKELDWLRAGLADMLITDLSRSNKLSVLSRQQVHMLMARLQRSEDADIRMDEAMGDLAQKQSGGNCPRQFRYARRTRSCGGSTARRAQRPAYCR